jgi:hypothetical protein
MRPSIDARDVRRVPPAPADRRTIVEEILVVLWLSILADAAYAILSLIEAPVSGIVVAAVDQSNAFARQVLGFVFGIAPAFLVLHLVRRTGEGTVVVGLGAGAARARSGPRGTRPAAPSSRSSSAWRASASTSPLSSSM